MEDFKQRIPARAIGTGGISETEVLVQVVEPRSGTQLSLRAKANGGRSAETQVTLSLDRLSFNFVLDAQVQALMEEVRRRIASGAGDAELLDLARGLENALKIRTGYKPFLQQIRDSAAFDILMTVRSLVATVPPEEAKLNLALAAIWTANKFFLVGSSPPSLSAISSMSLTQARIVKTAYSSGESILAAQGSNCGPNISCTECFWYTVQNICGPMSVLLEILCITQAFVEWLFCLP